MGAGTNEIGRRTVNLFLISGEGNYSMNSKVFLGRITARQSDREISEKAQRVFKLGDFWHCFKENDFTALKVHVGEPPNNTYIRAGCLKGLVEQLRELRTRPFVTDTCTLYRGRRQNAVDHTTVAGEHGFDTAGLGIPFIIADGLFGTNETAVQINGELNKEVYIASEITRCQSLLGVAHLTGHPGTCAAATIKTLGMGCASRKGKLRQHSAINPKINDKCVLCGDCISSCPVDAISKGEEKAAIDDDKCIGCGECLAVCRFNAVEFDWERENELLQKDMAEHALGALKGKQGRAAFFNFVMSVSEGCDCFDKKDMKIICDDVGILASTDPVAVDKAALDLVEQQSGKTMIELVGNEKLDPRFQIEHAEKIGLGSSRYELVEVD